MDTLTQMALGGAVGEAVLGRKVGNKAVIWGAVSGAIPDLDVLAGPFLNTVDQVAFHRGFTHSITFALFFAPVLGYFIYRFYRKQEATFWDWSKLAFWAVVTHPLLDNFTSYGTQFFWPFSDYRIAISSIFVIDPFYSVPLFISVIIVLFFRSSPRRRMINYLGIGISSAYLLFTVVNKIYVTDVFQRNLQAQNIETTRILTSPTPLNNVLWRVIAEGPEGYWEGYYSLFEGDEPVRFSFTPGNRELLKNLPASPEIRKLIWITNGFYNLECKNGAIYLNDMRYGRWNGWGTFEGEYIFSYRIQQFGSAERMNLEVIREKPEFRINMMMLERFAVRLLGKTVLESHRVE